MTRQQVLLEKINPQLKEIVKDLKNEKLPYLQATSIEGYEVRIKKKDFDLPDSLPPECEDCGYQMTYDDWFQDDASYFCPECGTPADEE